MIYFIASPAMGMVKIGRSKNPKARLEKMQAHSADRLVLLCAFDAPASVEARFHTLLIEHHSHNEWFRNAPEVRRVVDEVLKGTFDFDGLPEVARKAWCHERRRNGSVCPNGRPYRRAA